MAICIVDKTFAEVNFINNSFVCEAFCFILSEECHTHETVSNKLVSKNCNKSHILKQILYLLIFFCGINSDRKNPATQCGPRQYIKPNCYPKLKNLTSFVI